MEYDYKNGKIRVLDIIDSPNENVEVDEIPSNKAFTFKNGFYGYVSSIFVDIRNSTELFKNNRKKSTAKIIRSFTSEIITILNKVPNRREIGIRGDCVYAIYAASNADIDLEIFEAAIYINTYLKMLNTILANKQMPTIEAGIGVSTHQDLVIKAGRESSGVHSKVWIGEAVTFASKLSNKSKKIILVQSSFLLNFTIL